MPYHPLTNETGSGDDPDRRREEATQLCEWLQDHFAQLSDKEQGFVEQMGDDSAFVSPKQLLWLRDIWSRFA